MLLHRKNDRREASSRSLIVCAAPGPDAGRILFDSIQERRARQDPRDAGANAVVEVAAVLTRLLVERHRRFDIGRGDGTPVRAPRQIREDLRRRTPAPSAADAGRHTKSRSRLGVLLTPFTLYGPSTFTARSLGRPPTMWISWLSRSEGCHTSCRWNGRSFHVKPTSCGPAVTRDASGHPRVDQHLRLVHVAGLDLVVLRARRSAPNTLRRHRSVMTKVYGVSLPSTPA